MKKILEIISYILIVLPLRFAQIFVIVLFIYVILELILPKKSKNKLDKIITKILKK